MKQFCETALLFAVIVLVSLVAMSFVTDAHAAGFDNPVERAVGMHPEACLAGGGGAVRRHFVCAAQGDLQFRGVRAAGDGDGDERGAGQAADGR